LDAFAVYKRMVRSASALVDAHEIRFGADGGGMACRITMSAGIFLARSGRWIVDFYLIMHLPLHAVAD
jgi:hypothetical protein